MNKRQFKKALKEKTGCTIQHNGWCCGTCFFALDDNLINQDWQSLLFFRGDTPKQDLHNLPDNPIESINKIAKLVGL